MFSIFWAKLGPQAQKRQFLAKIGYAEKWIFPKTVISNFGYIAPKCMFGTIFQYEILIFSGTHLKNFTTIDFVILVKNVPLLDERFMGPQKGSLLAQMAPFGLN